SCRYVNPYCKRSEDVCDERYSHEVASEYEPSCNNESHPSSCTAEVLQTDEHSTSLDNDSGADGLVIREKRKQANVSAKRHKYQFYFELEPAVEVVSTHDDSEQSTVTHISDLTLATKYPSRKVKRECVSCVEDSFLCERELFINYPKVENRKGHKKSSMSRYNRLHKPANLP
ncbi:uncharacterized protein VICG_02201, partial [Vittaforma corneae ATCC 50505]